MAVTSIKITNEVRDRLAQVASQDFGGSTLSETVDRLIAEHEDARLKEEILAGYRRLQSDPQAWAEYVGELEEWAELGAEAVRRSVE